jgi:hypothetical protein
MVARTLLVVDDDADDFFLVQSALESRTQFMTHEPTSSFKGIECG